ncbi:hypothetical protein FJY94_02150 [Candidatus Kaiserbacteria bacterium]|nr:hypothetical protein [Candidatus Kaiserbacteria bacterium]
MNNDLSRILVAGVLVVLLVSLCDPFMLLMPSAVQMAALLAATLFAVVWAGFVVAEQSHDERELVHRMHAGHIAYLSGIGVLTVALLVQGFEHAIDPWILVALGVMVVSKVAARWYSERYH